jgi:3-deoxy-D-manno-octulosonic-acid transferase
MRRQWQLAGRPVWIAASTHPGEEAVVIEAHRLLRETIPGACLLLAPRHPERADSVVSLVKSAGLSVVRQSRITAALSDEPAVLLCDSMGQLQYLYGLSRVAFLGGSLVSVGGHNPIEAAICGQPLIMGPETFNFSDVVAAFSDAECLFTVTNAQDLADRLRGLLEDEALRSRLGAAARRVVAENTGGTERLLELLRTEIRARSVVQQ